MDILLDVICGVESALQEGIEHHDRCLSTLVLVYFAHRMGLCDRVCQVLVCRGKYGLAGGRVFSSFWTVPLCLPTVTQSLLVVCPFAAKFCV